MLLQLPLQRLSDWSDVSVTDPSSPLYHLMTLSVDTRIQFPTVSVPFNYDWTRPLSDRVNWYSVYRATADLSRHKWVSQRPAKPLADRGTGILHLHRPVDLPKDHVWDWAGVDGLWECSSLPGYGRRTNDKEYDDLPEYQDMFPTRFYLNATNCRADVNAAYAQFAPTSTDDLWDTFPELDVQVALPPVFFHGHVVTVKHDVPTRPCFVYGAVHVSGDELPEIVWIFATSLPSGPPGNLMMRGVQIGGCRSRSGVAGVSTVKPRTS